MEPEDYRRLEGAADRFKVNHPELQVIPAGRPGMNYFCVDLAILQNCEAHKDPSDTEYQRAIELKKAWLAIVRRILDNKKADGVGYGYVGYSV